MLLTAEFITVSN